MAELPEHRETRRKSLSKKAKLLRFLEKRRIVSFTEILQLLGSINTAKHYVMELKRAGVLKHRDVLRLDGRPVVVYFVSRKGLEQYKEELQKRKQKKVELLQSLNQKRKKRRLSDELL